MAFRYIKQIKKKCNQYIEELSQKEFVKKDLLTKPNVPNTANNLLCYTNSEISNSNILFYE